MFQEFVSLSGLLVLSVVSLVLAIAGTHIMGSWKASTH